MKFYNIFLRSVLKYIFAVILFFVFYTLTVVLVFKWFNPPVTAFILSKSYDDLFPEFVKTKAKQNWTSLNEIDDKLKLAVIASEDQKFFDHWGFDLKQIKIAFEETGTKKRKRGASTITMQVAKNMFLWDSKNIFRKMLESYYTLIIEILWSKERILEVYLNIAEFGNNVYGAQAAAKYHFNKNVSKLEENDAAFLASILPNPTRYTWENRTPYIKRRMTRIIKQMSLMGGMEFLHHFIN